MRRPIGHQLIQGLVQFNMALAMLFVGQSSASILISRTK